ncbi:MAG: cobyrinate a,c-diamide synthase [Desulfovibrio sp.]
MPAPLPHTPAQCPRGLLVAGTRSGCGKTSVSLGIMAALARRGLDVRPFKAGPDFIDPLHHALAAGRTSNNLDGWMLPRVCVQEIFVRNACGGHVAVAEGVMGLFDGASGRDECGSSAELAKWLGLPVLLVVDAASMARSVAALVGGFARFDPELRFAGVVLNRVGSARHEELLREALESLPDLPLLGCLPRAEGLELPSRHLGLVTPESKDRVYARLAHWVETHLDLDGLLAGLPVSDLALPAAGAANSGQISGRVRLGVAQDAAFCFCYAENLRLLEQAGAEIVFFSPLHDVELPPDLHGLYLPGGYPELHASGLEANVSMRAAVRAFCASGRPVYAECGGFLYLLAELTDSAGVERVMCGVYPGRATMRDRFRALGYREARFLRDTPLGRAGMVARGHEFHYSELAEEPGGENTYVVLDRLGRDALAGGWLTGPKDNVLGSYVHLHFGSNPAMACAFVQRCRTAVA